MPPCDKTPVIPTVPSERAELESNVTEPVALDANTETLLIGIFELKLLSTKLPGPDKPNIGDKIAPD